MMRNTYQNGIKPGIGASQQRVLRMLEQGKATPFMQAVDLEESVPDKIFLYQAAFCFQSDRAIYFENLLLMNNLARRYRSTIELLEILPEERWTPRCFVSAFHAYNRLDGHREAAAAFEKMDNRYKTDKIMIDAALCYARLADFETAAEIARYIPLPVEKDRKTFKIFLLRTLCVDDQREKQSAIDFAEQNKGLWDEEARFFIARLALQTRDFRKVEGLYVWESGSRLENRTGYFYQVMADYYLAADEPAQVRRMLIEGQGKLPLDFLCKTANQFARNYFMVQCPNTRQVLLKLYENLQRVEWENNVLAAAASAYYCQRNWEQLIGAAERIPLGQWEYSTAVIYVEACGRTGQQGKIDALAGHVPEFNLRGAIAVWQDKQNEPDTLEDKMRMAHSLAAEGSCREAAAIYQTFKKRHFTPEVAYDYVLCLFKLGQFQYAHNVLGQIIEKEEWNEPLARLAAQIEAALPAPGSKRLFNDAMIAVGENEWDKAIELFLRIPLQNWNNEIVRQLILCYRQLDRLQDARNLLTTVWTQEKWNAKMSFLARGLGLEW